MSTTVERLGDWCASLNAGAVPQRVIEKAKLQVLSVLAAVYSGYHARAARALREIILSTRANGRSSVFPSRERSSPTVAVVANAAASMAIDYDDYLFMGHTGHSAVLGALAYGEERGSSGLDALLAQIAANEIGGRLGASVAIGPQNGQLWTHIHAVCAAVAAARLENLDARKTANAIAISLYQPPMAMWPGFMGPDSKLLSAGFPARDGLLAARAASWGLTGPLDILDHPLGFGAYFAHQFMPFMFTGLGDVWVTDTLSFKMVPGCAYLSTAVEAMLQVCQEFEQAHGRRLQAADITRCIVRTNLLTARMQQLAMAASGGELGSIRINFSLPHSIGVCLAEGGLGPAELAEDRIAEKQSVIEAAASKVELVHDWSMTLEMFARMSAFFPIVHLLQEMELRNLQAGVPLGVPNGLGARAIKRSEMLRIISYLWSRLPDLVRSAPQAARKGLDAVVGQGMKERFDLSMADLERFSMVFPAEVEVHLADKKKLRARVDTPAGAAGRDFDEIKGMVRRKFRQAAIPILGQEKTERALELVSRMEQLGHLDELTDAFCR